MLKTKTKLIQRFLILTSSGGVGHLQAAKAKEQELLDKYPGCFICTKDIFSDFTGKFIGLFFSNLWNNAKTKSNITALKMLIRMQPFADLVLFYPIYNGICKLIKKHNITHIIDTQNMGVTAILKALKKINSTKKEPINYVKILTDLPTKNSIHFFSPIKKISSKKKMGLKIVSTKPLLEEGISEEVFWMQTCGLEKKNISYDTFPLRKAFYNSPNQKTHENLTIAVNIHNQPLSTLICKTASFGSTDLIIKNNHLDVHIPRETQLTLIMLGGYPNEKAITGYIEQFILHCQKQKHLVCIFCNFGLKDSKTLFSKIFNLISKCPNYPKNLTILPLPYQEDTVIAPLLKRSNATITRAGGITCMELLSVCRGHSWIHQETTTTTSCMPIWERGNAHYLQEKMGAKFITPTSFVTTTQGYFQ